MGLHGSDTAELTLDSVRVDDDALMGEVGDGFKIAMSALDSGPLLGRRGLRRHLPGLARRVGRLREGARAVRAPDRVVPARAGDDRRHARADRRGAHARLPRRLPEGPGPPVDDRDVDRQALRDRGGAELLAPRDPGPRRLGLRRRPPGRALLPRRARDHALRGHLADPEADHRARGDRDQRADPRRGRRRPRRRHDGRRDRAARRGVGRAHARARPDRRLASALERGIALAREVEGRLEAGKAGTVAAAEELAELRRRRRDRGGAGVARAQAQAVRRASPRSCATTACSPPTRRR